MKKWAIPCQFGALTAPFNIYVGEPVSDAHPLEQQAAWLMRERGGVVPVAAYDSFDQLHAIALENGVSFEALCDYALGEASSPQAAGDAPRPEAAKGSGDEAEDDRGRRPD